MLTERWKVRNSTLLAFATALSLAAADWPRFRGPDGAAVSTERNLPVEWSDETGIVWKTKLPGPGTSSPIVSGERVFVTCYTGVDRSNAGSLDDLQRHLLCLDRGTGEIVWQKSIKARLPEDPFRGPGVPTHGYASSTPVADGEHVYVFFGKSGVFAFDFEGNQQWQADVGTGSDRLGFGSAASPVLYGDFVIVNATVESESIVALDKLTGKQAWKASSEGYGGTWSTPILVEADGQTDLVLNVTDEIWGLNPDTGKLRWYAVTGFRSPVCPSLVAKNGVVFATGSRGGGLVAVRVGGNGDVSGSHLKWRSRAGSYVPSPVVYGDYLYCINDQGIAQCLDVETGEVLYNNQRIGAGGVYASPVAGDGKLYIVSRDSGAVVLSAGGEFAVLGQNEFASDGSIFNASPAISEGQLLLRSDESLYCVGATQ